jgi:hypothetical protein
MKNNRSLLASDLVDSIVGYALVALGLGIPLGIIFGFAVLLNWL